MSEEIGKLRNQVARLTEQVAMLIADNKKKKIALEYVRSLVDSTSEPAKMIRAAIGDEP